MAVQIQYRRGTAAENDAFTGANAEITVDSTNGTLRIHDGITPGGSNLATVGYVTSSVAAVSAITNGTSSVAVISSGGNIRSNVAGSTITLLTSAGMAVTGVTTVSGNANVGNLGTAGLVVATGNVTGGNLITAGLVSATGNITGGNLNTGAQVIATGNITGGNLNTGAQVVATGNITGGNLVTAGLLSVNSGNASGAVIVNAGGNATGNIGSATGYFNTLHATATKALYADLAEMYVADQIYSPGTVVSFGGTHEITASSVDSDVRVAGVVSTNPSYIMNSAQEGDHVLPLALSGRVPTRVTGAVRKGDMMVSAGDGTARAESAPAVGSVIGKALEDFPGGTGTIEVVIGRL